MYDNPRRRRRRSVDWFVGRVAMLLCAFMAFIFAIAVISTKLLPGKLLAVLFLALILIVVLVGLLTWKSRYRVRYIIGLILALVMMVVFGIGFKPNTMLGQGQIKVFKNQAF